MVIDLIALLGSGSSRCQDCKDGRDGKDGKDGTDSTAGRDGQYVVYINEEYIHVIQYLKVFWQCMSG